MNNGIAFLTNNNGTMLLKQENADGPVCVHTFHGFYDFDGTENDVIIPAGEMVMLINYYRYIKDNNIRKNNRIYTHFKKFYNSTKTS